MLRRTIVVVALALAGLLVLAGPAAAHVEVDPGEAEAGATVTLTFRFHHGLEGTATTGLEVKLPTGAELVDVPAVPGWTSTVTDDRSVVTWTGGSVPDGQEGAFPLVVRLPEQAGTALFPVIQTTEAGELAWISAEEGEDESERPAPRVELTGGEPPASTTTSVPRRDLPRTALEAEQRDDGGGSLAPWLVGAGLAALVAVVVGGSILRRRAG